MAQKNATPTKSQQKVIKRKGLQPVLYVVIKDLHHSIIVKHRITGDVKVLGK